MRHIRRNFNPFHRYSHLAKIAEVEVPNAFNTDVPLPPDTPRVPPLREQNTEPRHRNLEAQRRDNISNTDTTSRARHTQSSLQQSTMPSSSHRLRHQKRGHFAINSFQPSNPPAWTNSDPTVTSSHTSSGTRATAERQMNGLFVSPRTTYPEPESARDFGDVKVVFSTSGQTTELEISGPSSEAALKSVSHMLPLLFMSKHVCITIDDNGMDSNVIPEYNTAAVASIQRSLQDCKVQSLKWRGPERFFSAIWYPFCAGLRSLRHLSIDFNGTMELSSLRTIIVNSQYLEELSALSEIRNMEYAVFQGTNSKEVAKNLRILKIKYSRASITNFIKSIQFDSLSRIDLGVPYQDDSTTNIVTGLVEAFPGATRNGYNPQLRIVHPELAYITSEILSIDAREIGWGCSGNEHLTDKGWFVWLMS